MLSRCSKQRACGGRAPVMWGVSIWPAEGGPKGLLWGMEVEASLAKDSNCYKYRPHGRNRSALCNFTLSTQPGLQGWEPAWTIAHPALPALLVFILTGKNFFYLL